MFLIVFVIKKKMFVDTFILITNVMDVTVEYLDPGFKWVRLGINEIVEKNFKIDEFITSHIRNEYERYYMYQNFKLATNGLPPIQTLELNQHYENTSLVLEPMIEQNTSVELDTSSNELIEQDLKTVKKVFYHLGPYKCNIDVKPGFNTDQSLFYLRKNILLDSIRLERKIVQLLGEVSLNENSLIFKSLEEYQDTVFNFVNKLKNSGSTPANNIRNDLYDLVNIRLKLINSIQNDTYLSDVKNSNNYSRILSETRSFLSYKTDVPPEYSNVDQYRRALLDISVDTLHDTTKSAICGIYPKK